MTLQDKMKKYNVDASAKSLKGDVARAPAIARRG
jgi:hypothetical protein